MCALPSRADYDIFNPICTGSFPPLNTVSVSPSFSHKFGKTRCWRTQSPEACCGSGYDCNFLTEGLLMIAVLIGILPKCIQVISNTDKQCS